MSPPEPPARAHLPPFVDLDWVAARPGTVRLVDCRWSLDGSVGHADYLAGHLPGAVFADLDRDLAGPPDPARGRHPLPDPDDFALAMQRLGIHDDTPVVAYDTAGGGVAARLAWMLRILGHPAAVLDDDVAEAGAALEEGPVDVVAGSFSPRPWPPEAVADAGAVDRAVAGGAAVVIDARAPERYRGEQEPIDPRAGHVPGAVNAWWQDNLVDGHLADVATLRRRYEQLAGGRPAIVHCGSGVTACHDALAMEAAGMARPRVYVGSWSAWSSDPARPVATGAEAAG
jgi:thiosulfate/3-mercaptopyruvate sulfurtransferase